MTFDDHYLRPTAVGLLIGDHSKAVRVLDRMPQVLLLELARATVDADLRSLHADSAPS